MFASLKNGKQNSLGAHRNEICCASIWLCCSYTCDI